MTTDLLLELSLAVYLIPLATFALLIFFHKRLPRSGDWIGTGMMFGAFAISLAVMIVKLVHYPDETIQSSFEWVNFGGVGGVVADTIELGLVVDNLSAVMVAVVMLVSSLVHLFSIGYMKGDIRYGRYFAYLSLFTFSMLGIALTNNFFLMYVSWELVGLSSYLLIGHWYEKKSAADAGKKAFLVNRVGDLGMFIGILILFANYHTFSFDAIFGAIGMNELPFQSEAWLTAAGILIFCGAIGKSAQFPLHVWLPDAMEGPTPVSALIHAATMVAAGVYLIARTYPMYTADALNVIAVFGAVTAFIAATIALVQNDIKKVLAYSTVSQLGYMVLGLGVGAYSAGFFHLVTHAMFKAGLFLGSGSVIYAMHHALHHQNDHHTDAQDIRNLGGLRRKMPVTFWTFVIFTLAISGVPLTSGFLSKDEILAGTLAYGNVTGNWFIPIIGFLVAGMTAFYMFRLVILAFLGEHKGGHRLDYVRESPAVMTIPLVIFAGLSFFAFYSFNPLGAASGWFITLLSHPGTVVPLAVAATSREAFAEAMHHKHTLAMILSLTVAGIGILLAYATYQWKKIDPDVIAAKFPKIHKFLLNKWYFDEAYDFLFITPTIVAAKAFRWIDNNIVDGIVNGTAKWTSALTLGRKEVWEISSLSTYAYLLVALLCSGAVGYALVDALAPADVTILGMIWYGMVGLATAGLTFFLFYVGVGGFDHKIVDGLVNGITYVTGLFGLIFQRLQTGKVQTYLALALVGIMVFIMFIGF